MAVSCEACRLEVREPTAVFLRCEHAFHRMCLARWNLGADQMECPVCRAPVSDIDPYLRLWLHLEYLTLVVYLSGPPADRKLPEDLKRHLQDCLKQEYDEELAVFDAFCEPLPVHPSDWLFVDPWNARRFVKRVSEYARDDRDRDLLKAMLS